MQPNEGTPQESRGIGFHSWPVLARYQVELWAPEMLMNANVQFQIIELGGTGFGSPKS